MRFDNYKTYKSQGSGEYKISDISKIGTGVVIEDGVRIFHPENIVLGKDVYIGHDTILKAYFKNKLIIDDYTWIGQGCFLHSAAGITIGKAVGIGPGVKILTSYHKEEELNKPILFCHLEFKEVIIEDGCDIGIGAIILPGIKIGQGSIIGAGTVVTKNIEPYSVAVGNPAKIIRKRNANVSF